MTYEEAVAEMRLGKRVVHEAFCGDEFFEMQHGTIIDEMGYNMDEWFRAWDYSSDYDWQKTGWSVKGHQQQLEQEDENV